MPVRDLLMAASGAAAPSDPDFEYVTLLLDGNGTNGGQNNTFLDSSTNNFTITRNGNTTQGSFSPYGTLWSNFFNGTSSYLTATNNTAYAFGTGDFCVEAWVFLTSTPSGQMVVGSTYQNSSSGFTFSIESNVIKVRLLGDPVVLSGGTSVITNTWNHVAVTRSGTSLRVFLNGTQDGSATNSSNVALNSTAFNIGRLTNNTGFLAGYISNLRVVKGSAVYTSNFTPSTTPLTAITNTSLLTCQSNRFIDNSSNAFTITTSGSPSVQRFSPFEPSDPYSTSVIGGSGYFDGSGDTLSLSRSALPTGTQTFTVEFWLYWNAIPSSDAVFIGAWDGSNTGIMVGIFNFGNNISVALASAGVTFGSKNQLTAGAWNHVAIVRNGNSWSCYINGSLDTSGTQTNSNSTSGGGSTFIGSQQGSVNFLAGYISNIRVVLGTAVYTSNFTPPTAPLTAITNTSLLCNFTNASIADLAMQNNLETVGNAQVSTSVKKFGTGSLAFDGTGDRLKFKTPQPFIFGTGNFTVEGWVYFNSVATAVLIGDVNNNTGASVWSVLFNSASNVLRLTCNASTTYSFSWTPVATTWYHFAVCRSGTSLRAFINGTQIGTTQTSSDNIASTNGSGDFYLGSTNDGALQLNGNLDDVRVSNLARYTANFTAPTAPFPIY